MGSAESRRGLDPGLPGGGAGFPVDPTERLLLLHVLAGPRPQLPQPDMLPSREAAAPCACRAGSPPEAPAPRGSHAPLGGTGRIIPASRRGPPSQGGSNVLWLSTWRDEKFLSVCGYRPRCQLEEPWFGKADPVGFSLSPGPGRVALPRAEPPPRPGSPPL